MGLGPGEALPEERRVAVVEVPGAPHGAVPAPGAVPGEGGRGDQQGPAPGKRVEGLGLEAVGAVPLPVEGHEERRRSSPPGGQVEPPGNREEEGERALDDGAGGGAPPRGHTSVSEASGASGPPFTLYRQQRSPESMCSTRTTGTPRAREKTSFSMRQTSG